MIAQFIARYPRGRLTYQQTSFLEVTTAVEVHRIDFIGKLTARLKRGTYGELAYATQHPALRHYNESLSYLTVQAATRLPAEFLVAYEQCIAAATAGWRHLVPIWSGTHPTYRVARLRNATIPTWLSGTFPDFIAQQLVALSHHYQLAVTCRPHQHWPTHPGKVAPPFALLSIGPSYVIARDFYVSTCVGSAYLAATNSWLSTCHRAK
jgi:hypothetical protein